LQSNVGYRLTILVTDGGGLQNTCTVFFEFSQAPAILWWAPSTSYTLISGSSSSSPTRFLDVLQNSTWIQGFNPPNPTLPAPNNGFNSNISFGTVRLSNDADVTMTAEFRALDNDPLKSELLGLVRVEHKFSETGNFASPDYTLVVIGAGVSTNTSPTYTASIPFTMPAGWGQQPQTPNNAYNVRTEVTYTNLGPFTGNPYIQFYLKALA
jgi:hypothetical protein